MSILILAYKQAGCRYRIIYTREYSLPVKNKNKIILNSYVMSKLDFPLLFN